jgi:predicted Zn-dependent peptidase
MMARLLFLLLPALLAGQSLKDFEKKVTEFTLPNGLHFIVIERHEAPVVSFHTYVNVGSVDDPGGQTGLAHMFEHMAFKGTPTIGTKNWPEERKALAAVEEVYDRLDAERRKGTHADAKKVEALEAELKAAMDKADSLVEENEYDRMVESNGGVDMNAGTGEDSTNYYYSFPSNRTELWFLLESSRFLQPVFREFYKERDVVAEERRMRVESSPQGKLVEAMLATAYAAHPYRNMPGGWASDIASFRRPDAERFYKQHYVPGNITIGIAGDVNPAEARRLAEKYFARLPRGPLPEPVHTAEPAQEGEKRVLVESPAQPFLAIAYSRIIPPDDTVLDVVNEICRAGALIYDIARNRSRLWRRQPGHLPGGTILRCSLFFVAWARGSTVGGERKGTIHNHRAGEKHQGRRGDSESRQDETSRRSDPQAGEQ